MLSYAPRWVTNRAPRNPPRPQDNAPGKRFCRACGAGLLLTCGVCQAELEPDSRFCGECGSPVDGSRAATVQTAAAALMPPPSSAPVAERRICSVLFCDLVGFTPLSESRDPEEVRELLSQYFDIARTIIGRYGGVVEKFIGDAVMAVWGDTRRGRG